MPNFTVAAVASRSAVKKGSKSGPPPRAQRTTSEKWDDDDLDDAKGPADKPPKSCGFLCCMKSILDFLNSTKVSFCFYIAFVIVFQSLAEQLRSPTEFFFDKMIADTFIDNHFDSSHNTFESIRRVADVYEWGNNVLIAGLLGNAGPCAADVGAVGLFELDPGNVSAAVLAKKCNDDVWPDGGESFFVEGASGWTVREQMMRMDQLDWTEGIFIRQVRATPTPASECTMPPFASACYGPPSNKPQGQLPFGYNWTTGTSEDPPPWAPWDYHTSAWLGTDPEAKSAFMPSLEMYDGGGYAAAAIPFFSNVLLPQQRGSASEVADFRAYAIRGGGTASLEAFCGMATPAADIPAPSSTSFDPAKGAFFCVRLSFNSEQIHQLCDPNEPYADPLGRTTGAVRAAVEEWWNDLKRGHFIDLQTRFVQIILPFRNSNEGARSRVKLMLETTGYGSVLPSYDMETRIEGGTTSTDGRLYANIAFGFCIFFMLLEGVELASSGPWKYFSDAWNLMDWLNFGIFLIFWSTLNDLYSYEADRSCSTLCATVGYCDDWRVMKTMMDAKTYLSYCMCIQLLKVIKFTDLLVPKMSLASAVLRKARLELAFFTFVFVISMLAFSQLFYVQLGPVMAAFSTQQAAIISLTRSLFGDFDIDAIMNNSKDYLNAMLFLAYLFIAVFIMLSMFLAILGEAQSYVRSDEEAAKEAAKEEGTILSEYGIFDEASAAMRRSFRCVRASLCPRAKPDDGSATDDPEAPDSPTPHPDVVKAELAKQRKREREEAPATYKDLSRMQEKLAATLRAEMGTLLAVNAAANAAGAISGVPSAVGVPSNFGIAPSPSAPNLGRRSSPEANAALGRARSHRRNLRRTESNSQFNGVITAPTETDSNLGDTAAS